MKKLLSVVLALLMLAVMLPVTAMADDIPILGSDKVWKNVNPKNVQDVLDGKHGSINGTTIELSAGNYDKIEFGRATAYEDSDTKYYLSGAVSDVDTIKKDIDDHPNGGAGKREYVRSMSNVTLKAADGAAVTINGLVAFGGQVNSTKWYSRDFVADRDMSATVNNNICNGVQREHNKKLNNGLPILHKVPPKRDYGRYFCIMAEKGGTSHGGLTEKLSSFFHAKKQEVNAYGR